MPTRRGPTLSIQRPPKNAANPRKRIASEKIRLTLDTDVSKWSDSGLRNTLQA